MRLFYTDVFVLPLPPARIWSAFSEVAALAACMPGMAVEAVDGPRVRGQLAVKAGPIRAQFAMVAEIAREDATRSGTVDAEGRDRITRSATLARLHYRLAAAPGDDAASELQVECAMRIEGRLAEFSRPEIVESLAAQMTRQFAANVERWLLGADPSASAAGPIQLGLREIAVAWWNALRQALRRKLGRQAHPPKR